MSGQDIYGHLRDSTRLVQGNPGPSPRLIRRFSDGLEEEHSTEAVSDGLILKVSHDRRHEERLELLKREWAFLLADAGHLAQMYGYKPLVTV
jgi:hypothetical protein